MKVVFVFVIGVLFFFFFKNLVLALILQGFQNYVNGQGGIFSLPIVNCPKLMQNHFFFFLPFLESLANLKIVVKPFWKIICIFFYQH